MSEKLERLHAVVEGRVQGVGFRAFVQQHALGLDLTGWVHNTYEGNVEVLAEGPRSTLDFFLERLNAGPRGSFVTRVRIDWEPASGEFVTFNVTRTV